MPSISAVAAGQKATASIENSEITAINAIADNRVIPTSVSGAGTALGANGVVTITAATVASVINGCFTSTYSAYRIEWDLSYTAGAGIPKFQLVVATVASTAAVYDQQRIATVLATATADQDIAGTSWNVGATNNTVAGKFVGTTKLYQPFVAVATYGYSHGFQAPNPMTAANTTAVGMRGHLHRTATAYDGFTLLASGTVSGTIRIYGMNDN